MAIRRDEELSLVPGFAGVAEVADVRDVVAAALDASHIVPPDRLEALMMQAAVAIGATDVSMWLIDYGQAYLMPSVAVDVGRRVGRSDAALAVANTAAGRAFTTAAPVESNEPQPHRWIPLVDGTERLGVIRIEFAQPLTAAQRRVGDSLASLFGELVVTKRAHTDSYAIQRRHEPMSLAAELQWQQLPPLETSTPSITVAGFLEPAYSVGGDGFDYSVNGDDLDITIYDAVGHGLHAALLSALIIASLRHSRRSGLDLAARLDAADEVIDANFPSDFVTAQLAMLSTKTGVLRWVNAGHPPPMLVRDGTVVGELTCPPRTPVGFHRLQSSPAVVATVSLQPGDRVLFYTDGLVESRRPGGERFGVERLADLLQRAHHDRHGCAETVRRLGHAVVEHADYELSDDATMVLLEWRGGDGLGRRS